jgi:large subunit ribosomal protein L22
MGERKKLSSSLRKEAKKNVAIASLNDCPTSPRKMRLMVDLIRGQEVNMALSILKYSKKESSLKLSKLILSSISNWQSKNQSEDVETANLFVKEIFVDSAKMLKRVRPAPQGRANRIRKRSNHVTVILDSKKIES